MNDIESEKINDEWWDEFDEREHAKSDISWFKMAIPLAFAFVSGFILFYDRGNVPCLPMGFIFMGNLMASIIIGEKSKELAVSLSFSSPGSCYYF
jgi:hypothetical protein